MWCLFTLYIRLFTLNDHCLFTYWSCSIHIKQQYEEIKTLWAYCYLTVFFILKQNRKPETRPNVRVFYLDLFVKYRNSTVECLKRCFIGRTVRSQTVLLFLIWGRGFPENTSSCCSSALSREYQTLAVSILEAEIRKHGKTWRDSLWRSFKRTDVGVLRDSSRSLNASVQTSRGSFIQPALGGFMVSSLTLSYISNPTSNYLLAIRRWRSWFL